MDKYELIGFGTILYLYTLFSSDTMAKPGLTELQAACNN
jgi:hypothetical protein